VRLRQKIRRSGVKRAIWAANQLRSKPCPYGGGHKSFDDRGYDCSGTISYALGAAGLLPSPISSPSFASYGERVLANGSPSMRERAILRLIAGLATRYDAVRSLHRQMGAALASPLSAAARFDARQPIVVGLCCPGSAAGIDSRTKGRPNDSQRLVCKQL